jgi:hypothetical protein
MHHDLDSAEQVIPNRVLIIQSQNLQSQSLRRDFLVPLWVEAVWREELDEEYQATMTPEPALSAPQRPSRISSNSRTSPNSQRPRVLILCSGDRFRAMRWAVHYLRIFEAVRFVRRMAE